jgi:hypothetical protein
MKHFDITRKPLEKTVQYSSKISEEEEKIMKMISESEDKLEYDSYLVKTFWSVGIADPFPDESTVANQDKDLIATRSF